MGQDTRIISPAALQDSLVLSPPPGSLGLRRVLVFDFTAQPDQDLIGGGSFTIGGLTWVVDNEANASTFAIEEGVGLKIFPNATASAWGRPSTATAPSLQLADYETQLGGRKVGEAIIRLHLDASSADAATEAAGVSVIDTFNSSFGLSAGVGHNGVNAIMRGYKDTTIGTIDPITASHAGADAVIGLEVWPLSINAFTGEASGGLPGFADMTSRARASTLGNFASGQLGASPQDLFLYAEPNNTDGNFQPVFKRLEVWFIEASSLP